MAGGAGTPGIRACDALLEHGLSGLMIIDLNPAVAKKEIAAMQAKFPDAQVRALDRPVDVTDEEAVEAAVEDATRELGPITTLISFVGVVGCGVGAVRHSDEHDKPGLHGHNPERGRWDHEAQGDLGRAESKRENGKP